MNVEEFSLCFAAVILYLYENFSNGMKEYHKKILEERSDFKEYHNFLQQMTNIFLKIPTILNKLNHFALNRKINKENIDYLKQKLIPYTHLEVINKINEETKNKKTKKIYNILKSTSLNDEQILHHINILKFRKTTFDAYNVFNVRKKDDILKILFSQYGVKYSFIKTLYEFFGKVSLSKHTHMLFDQQLEAFRVDIEILCHKLGILPFGLIHAQRQESEIFNK